MARSVSWTPTGGSVTHEVFFWGGYQWVRIYAGPAASFQVESPKGTYRWMVADVLADGTRVSQRDYGFWTTVPY